MKLITFPNLGNTCYINSVLQCFIYNPYFRKFCDIPDLKKIIIESDIIKNNEYLNVNYNLTIFVNMFFNKKNQFKRFQQNDAHEFLIEFLDILVTEVHGRMDSCSLKNKKWNESSCIIVNGITIGEFQIHNHRNCIKFRWSFEKLLNLFGGNFEIIDLSL